MMPEKVALYLICGSVVGMLRDLASTGGLTMPRCVRTPDGAKILRLGFLTSMLIGAVVAALVDGSLITAAGWAYAGPEALERLFNFKAMKQRVT